MANLVSDGSIFKTDAHGWSGYLKNPRTGKRKYFYGKSRKIVKEKMNKYLETYNLINEDVAKDSVEHFFDSWLDGLKLTIKPKTYDVKYYIVHSFIIPELSCISVGDITPSDIQALIDNVTNKGYSYSVVQKVYNNLNQRFKLAVARRELPYNPVVGIHLPKLSKTSKEEIRFFSRSELDSILTEAERETPDGTPVYRHGYAFRLLAYTGMRAGEALALTWDDIDFENKMIFVNKNIVTVQDREKGGIKRIVQDSTKTASSTRIIPISSNAELALKGLKNTQPEGCAYVISTANKTPVYTKNLSRTFDRIQTAAGIEEHGTLHSLRHTFATRLLSVGEDVKVVSELLGHANITITYDTYIHVIDEQKLKAVQKIDEI